MKATVLILLLMLVGAQVQGKPVSACLPMEAGKTLARLVDSGELLEPLGPRWSLESANIEISRLVLTFNAEPGIRMGVILQKAGPGAARGRWFTYEFFHNQGPPTVEDLDRLTGAAHRVDGAFASSPWIDCLESTNSKGETSRKPPPAGPGGAGVVHGGSRIALPVWLTLVLGFCQLVLILLGLSSALWNRTPPPTRSRP